MDEPVSLESDKQLSEFISVRKFSHIYSIVERQKYNLLDFREIPDSHWPIFAGCGNIPIGLVHVEVSYEVAMAEEGGLELGALSVPDFNFANEWGRGDLQIVGAGYDIFSSFVKCHAWNGSAACEFIVEAAMSEDGLDVLETFHL